MNIHIEVFFVGIEQHMFKKTLYRLSIFNSVVVLPI